MRSLLKLLFVALAILAIGKLLKPNSAVGKLVEFPLDVRPISGSSVQAGKPTILEFWATWCGPCRQTIPHLNRIYGEYSPKGLQVIGLTNEDSTTVATFQKQVPMHYTVAQDYNRKYSQMCGIRGIPHMVLLDSKGLAIWAGHPAAFSPEEHLPQLLK